MRRILLIWLFAYGIIFGLSAKSVNKNLAQHVAKNFYMERMSYDKFPGIASIQLVSFKGVDTYYAINIKKQKGFVLVAADDASIPVLGYSFYGSYDNINQPENFQKTLEQFNLQLEYIQKNNIQATAKISDQWKKYSKSIKGKAPIQSISPLLTTIWSQGCFYNDSTPVDSAGPCSHVVTGCVATAMAQVINYYNFPNTGSGSHSYNSNYGILTANFGSTNYLWNLMSDTLDAQSSTASVSAVATLISHCGIAVDMNYSPGGSGAFSQNAANAFAHYFNFDNGLQLLHKANFADSVWAQMVRNELDSLHPLYYDGSGSGGHAFVCDGYQSADYFHFNWGWSGSYNGYFLLSALNPGGMNFSNYCGAVFGMKPGVPKSCNGITDTLTAKAGNISDGSYGQDYQNNVSCSWLINPSGAVSVSLEFYTFNLQTGDSLYVYDGSNNSATLIAAYSGNSIPASIASSAGQMFVQFVSNSQTTASGWSAYYRSEYCNGLTVLNSMAGTITDGSGTETYNDNTNCYWLISNSNNQNIHLQFTSFQTELSFDYVDVYDGSTTAATQLGSFSGNQLPQLLTSTGGTMLIHFHSDGGVTDQGWEANYYTCGQPPKPYPSDTAFFCKNDTVMLVIPAYVDSFLWQYNGVVQTDTSKLLAVTQGGIYSYIAFSNSCPTDTSSLVMVKENPLPMVDLGYDTVLCDVFSLSLNADTGYVNYLWSTGDTTQSIIVNASTGAVQNIELKVTDINTCSNSDTINVKFIDCTSINQIASFEFELFPNPTQDVLHIQFPIVEDSIEVNMFDSQGKSVIHKMYSNVKSILINTNTLSSGMYYLKVKHNQDMFEKSFIKK